MTKSEEMCTFRKGDDGYYYPENKTAKKYFDKIGAKKISAYTAALLKDKTVKMNRSKFKVIRTNNSDIGKTITESDK